MPTDLPPDYKPAPMPPADPKGVPTPPDADSRDPGATPRPPHGGVPGRGGDIGGDSVDPTGAPGGAPAGVPSPGALPVF